MKAFICTIALWVVAVAGYSQSFSVQMPKALQSSNVPTWPLTHTKKPNNIQLEATSKTTSGSTGSNSKPASSIPAIPFIKLWLMTESNKEDDN